VQLIARNLFAGEEVAGHPGRVVRVVSWNLFHGRDDPPEPLGRLVWPGERRGRDYVQVNRSLVDEFAATLSELDWDVALLQEAPPRWLAPLRRATGASAAASVLTSRNQLAPLRAALADWNPDLIASHEGGSNQLLARPPWQIGETRFHTLARRPERRRLVWARLTAGDGVRLCVANLHASAVGDHSRAAHEAVAAAELCARWSGDDPLVLGGDFNLRPREHPWAFAELRERFGLAPATADDAVDHLLVRGAEVVDPPRRLPAPARERVRVDGFRIRLSDHALVAASLRVA
jgi:endonuclease/exonuclease/phosphatase family metal-dependent hydrolase